MGLFDIITKVSGHLFTLIILVAAMKFAFEGDATNMMISLIASMVARIVMVLEGDA